MNQSFRLLGFNFTSDCCCCFIIKIIIIIIIVIIIIIIIYPPFMLGYFRDVALRVAKAIVWVEMETIRYPNRVDRK